jgi:hypothetical protein
MVVDGEHFDVIARAGEPGVYDFRWTSGPNEGYGFGSAGHGSDGMTDGELEDAICNFLSQVDLNTGYIE